MQNFFEGLDNLKILIVGDLMLDRYIQGTASRISAEAPTIILKYNSTQDVLGGAANVAANITALGATAFLIGIVGNDEIGTSLLNIARNLNINIDNVFMVDRPTTLKTRFIAHSQQLLRVDTETCEPIPICIAQEIYKSYQELVPKVDAIILSQYEKGVLLPTLIIDFISLANLYHKPIVVDPKERYLDAYKHCTLFKLNLFGARKLAGYDGEFMSIAQLGKYFSEYLQSIVLLTLGDRGMELFYVNGNSNQILGVPKPIYNVTGAGDTVAAIIALGLAQACDCYYTAKLANIAASIVVSRSGTAIIDKQSLYEESQNIK